METHTFFLHLLVVLLSARIFAELAMRLKAPPVIGELLAGVILGPSLLGWLDATPVIRLLAEIGIIMLLFEVGLETNVRGMILAGPKALVVAIGGFIMPFVAGFAAAFWLFDLSVLVSLFIGGTLTATSIGITVRVLTDLKRQHGAEAQIVLGAAVLDDVLGVVLLALLYESSHGGSINLINASKVLIFVSIFFLVAPVAARLISRMLGHFDKVSGIPGLIPTTMVSLVLFFAWLAHVIGAPELLGGFAAGLALSRRFFLPFGVALHTDPGFARRVEKEMRPIVRLFTPIFFVTVGLSLNMHQIDWSSPDIWYFSVVFFLVAVIGKFAGALLIREPWTVRVIVGMAMAPRGEVGLVFAELGRASGIFSNELYAGMVMVIAMTTLAPPFFMKAYYKRYGSRLEAAATAEI
jgi:Kef-type K+ transport system membrane component KefB